MPPHLHPRSRTTSSLFATTVLVSFFVVALPHLLPCPVPRTKFADGDIMVDENGRRRRWKKREALETGQTRDGTLESSLQVTSDAVCPLPQRARRECPVPKPGGRLGQWMGFNKTDGEEKGKTGWGRGG
ncbi:hypothetical protein CDD81_3907 [Ophiocordyceps australis]|uniref:Alpha-1,3-mannosyltransferase n=1 Tax=Ophiocordyceps australis TaxID=1399860 RepID=A0A2C5YDA2_9HYPO|nr:hypothetical protein CDD81_3907 [Ophiocordyceps australis]